MKLWNRVELLEPFPAIYIPSLDAVVIADLHLGYEGIMAEQGVFIPKVQFEQEMRMLRQILDRQRAEQIILCGDVKHEFSETSYHEFVEVTELFNFLKSRFKGVTVVKGNHDNYLIRVTRRHGVELRGHLKADEFLFLHGHEHPPRLEAEVKYVVMAHEHPAVMLWDEVGGKEKLDCFLYGEGLNRRLLVLPAFSTLAEGSQINVAPREELLSPILRELVEVDELEAVGVSGEAGYLKFSKLGRLRP